MDKERETAKKVREALRTRIELMADDFSNRLGVINTYDYLLASTYLISDSSEKLYNLSERLYHSNEELNRLTRKLNRLTIVLIVLTALTFAATLNNLFRW